MRGQTVRLCLADTPFSFSCVCNARWRSDFEGKKSLLCSAAADFSAGQKLQLLATGLRYINANEPLIYRLSKKAALALALFCSLDCSTAISRSAAAAAVVVVVVSDCCRALTSSNLRFQSSPSVGEKPAPLSLLSQDTARGAACEPSVCALGKARQVNALSGHQLLLPTGWLAGWTFACSALS